MKDYTHIGFNCRQIIERMSKEGHNQTVIARTVGCNQSTVSREIHRLKTPYTAAAANKDAVKKQRKRRRKPLLETCEELLEHVSHYLLQRYSLAQSLKLTSKKHPSLPALTVQAVYNWLYSSNDPGKRILRKLMVRPRIAGGRGKVKPTSNKGKIPNMTPIGERPEWVENRTVFGDWEGDLVLGAKQQSTIITLVERKTRFTVIIPVPNRKTVTVVNAIIERMSDMPVRSITWDQGNELTNHGVLSEALGVPVYFAVARSPWQRGTNENTNGVLRRWLPKGTSVDVGTERIKEIENLTNGRPMIILSDATPEETYEKEIAIMHLKL